MDEDLLKFEVVIRAIVTVSPSAKDVATVAWNAKRQTEKLNAGMSVARPAFNTNALTTDEITYRAAREVAKDKARSLAASSFKGNEDDVEIYFSTVEVQDE